MYLFNKMLRKSQKCLHVANSEVSTLLLIASDNGLHKDSLTSAKWFLVCKLHMGHVIKMSSINIF